MTKEDFQKIVDTIPLQAGVYRFLDKNDYPIYIGKAKNLRNRLRSYFNAGNQHSNKTKVMLRYARSIQHTVVETEHDAFLMESTFIKRYQPRYNVLLKDGKSYGYICIKKERFPRVFYTRKVIRDGSTYFGPYTSKWRISLLMELIKELFELRTCSLYLSEKNIDAKKFKVCLEYHIENCKGPCEGLENEEHYNEKINQVKNILRGNFKQVKDHIYRQIEEQAQNLEFEKAQELKEKLVAFEDYQSKSTVVSTAIKDVDVFTIESDEEYAFVNMIRVINGAIINSHNAHLLLKMDEDHETILERIVPELRDRFNSAAPEVLSNINFKSYQEDFSVKKPQRGDKKKLLDLSLQNLKFNRLQFYKDQSSKTQKQTSAERILKTLQSDLNMENMPLHIECFDNSNFQGSYPVASCVVFKNAKPSKKDYRKYHIKEVVGPDDFASMKEIVTRRYSRLIKEEASLPDLIIIDGGKGQLSAAAAILKELNILDKLTVIGIAKKLEEIYFPEDPIPIHINKKSESLKLIQQARNEAHRFAITFHRNLRSKNATISSLEDIPGIGQKTADKLLIHFKSYARVREANTEELATVVGKIMAKKMKKYFKKLAREEEE